MPEDVLFCWSGGKDSAMALHALQSARDHRVTALLTTVTEQFDRISMHGVRRALLERQAESIGLPLHAVLIPPQCVNVTYEARMNQALHEHLGRGVRRVAFGDIFLEDLRVYREQNLAQIGMEALFPIWKRDSHELARDFLRLGFQAITVCVDPRVLDSSFAGRVLDESFFADLPPGVDPCGENGEFHTFVFDGPVFQKPIRFAVGEKVLRDGFYFCDLLPE
ncbi:MAG: protein of unknown function ATP-binding region [Candidatus Acidoferrum typicum]|jgi:uncharacterized protein (TIGR00290 family)|nr:protein of unknown function ATP-binding region [Candidatus Acidoferrum typicum]